MVKHQLIIHFLGRGERMEKAMIEKIKENKDKLNNSQLNDFIRERCLKKEWDFIYMLSSKLGLEIGIIIDKNDKCWVEWGEVSIVKHSPPVGSELPYKLWLHTHPNGDAYWSSTDQQTLKLSKSIIEKAVVLGKDGYLIASHSPVTNVENGIDLSDTYVDTGWTYHTFIKSGKNFGWRIYPKYKFEYKHDLDWYHIFLTLKKDFTQIDSFSIKTAIDEYKRFLHLKLKYLDESIAPTKMMDIVWHTHILDTKKYQDDCMKIFGKYLHHVPSNSSSDELDKKRFRRYRSNMKNLYFREFNTYPAGTDEESECCEGCE